MEVKLISGAEVLCFDASDIYPSLGDLVDALALLAVADLDRDVVWTMEPVEIEMQFRNDGAGLIELAVWQYPDWRRTNGSSTLVLSVRGDFGSVCLLFWRALSRLAGRFTPVEWQFRWSTHAFPVEELAQLTSVLRARGIIA